MATIYLLVTLAQMYQWNRGDGIRVIVLLTNLKDILETFSEFFLPV